MVVLYQLTPPQRVAFVLHDALALSFGEIAQVLSCSPATARQPAFDTQLTESGIVQVKPKI